MIQASLLQTLNISACGSAAILSPSFRNPLQASEDGGELNISQNKTKHIKQKLLYFVFADLTK